LARGALPTFAAVFLCREYTFCGKACLFLEKDFQFDKKLTKIIFDFIQRTRRWMGELPEDCGIFNSILGSIP
jgi:hypothetical protein